MKLLDHLSSEKQGN